MSKTTTLVRELLEGEDVIARSQLPIELAHLISLHQSNLLEIVRASGDWLTSDDDARRGRGIGLLGHVIVKCRKDAVTKQEARTLSEFFTTCIDPSTSDEVLIPALEGLAALAKFPAFTAAETISVCRSIFGRIDLLGRPQNTRYYFYLLIDAFIAHHRQALKRMGTEFLTGYAKLVTGEKDPRNLRLSFTIIRVILLEFEISNNTEELFDVTFCYFPITFSPPPNDPYGIKSEDLQISLRHCLSATPRFGPLALPLFIEKLAANTNTAKRQTLQALIDCFPVYGRAFVQPHASTLWEAFSVEIFHASDPEMEALARSALRSMLRTLYSDHAGDNTEMPKDEKASVLWKLCDSCNLELNDSDKTNAAPATRILASALAASATCAIYISSRVFPHILQIYKLPDEAHQRPSLFGVIARLLEGLRDCPSKQATTAFRPYCEEILSMATSGLRQQATREQALDCLVQLVRLPGNLQEDELVHAIQAMTQALLRKPSDAVIVHASLNGLVDIAEEHPDVIEKEVMPELFDLLPDEPGTAAISDAVSTYRLALATLSRLCIQPVLFESLMIRLLTRLELVLSKLASTTPPTAGLQIVRYAHELLSTLKTVIRAKIAAGHIDLVKHDDRIISRLYGIFAQLASATDAKQAEANTVLYDDAGCIIMSCLQYLGAKAQGGFARRLNAAFLDGQIAPLVDHQSSFNDDGRLSFAPFQSKDTIQSNQLRILYAYSTFPLRSEATNCLSGLDDFCNQLLRDLSASLPGPPFDVQCRLLASLVNKRTADLARFLDADLPEHWKQRVINSESGIRARRTALVCWTWAVRGLLLRSDSRAYLALQDLIDLFADDVLSQDAARSLAILSRDDDGALTKANHAVLKLLYKQRFFGFIVPKLVKGYQAGLSKAQNSAYLTGIASLLANMPKNTLLAELSQLQPLLIKALDLEELDLRSHVIDTIATLVKDSPESVKPQAAQIVSILTKSLATPDTDPSNKLSIRVRISALKCLAVFPDTTDWLTLHQRKTPLIKALGLVVDDPRRSVRKEAVDCRARWYLFKAP